MKTILSSLALLACTSVYAAPANLSSAVAELADTSTCTKALAGTLSATYSFLPESAQANFRSRLNTYQSLVGQARANLKTNVSNKAVYAAINAQMAKDSQWTVLGAPIGAAVTNCIGANVSFNGSVAEQKIVAAKAMNSMLTLQKAVR